MAYQEQVIHSDERLITVILKRGICLIAMALVAAAVPYELGRRRGSF